MGVREVLLQVARLTGQDQMHQLVVAPPSRLSSLPLRPGLVTVSMWAEGWRVLSANRVRVGCIQ